MLCGFNPNTRTNFFLLRSLSLSLPSRLPLPLHSSLHPSPKHTSNVIFSLNKSKQRQGKKIKNKATDLKDQAVDQYGKVSEKAKEQYQDVSGKVKDQYQNISSQVKETADKLASTVKEGYDKYKDQAVAKTAEVVKDVEKELDGLKS